jgi:hypothetical protein
MFAALVTPVASVLHGMAHASDGERHNQRGDVPVEDGCAARERRAETVVDAADHDHEVHAALHLADARTDAELVSVAALPIQRDQISVPAVRRILSTAFTARAPTNICHKAADLARAPPSR